MLHENLIRKAYSAFNARDVDTALSVMHPDVLWPNGWEGGYVRGHNEIRTYWSRQWKELEPDVEPLGFLERKDGRIEVQVHQTVKDKQGHLLFDGIVKHIYTFDEGLVKTMDIEKE
jgi:hypothetical protein